MLLSGLKIQTYLIKFDLYLGHFGLVLASLWVLNNLVLGWVWSPQKGPHWNPSLWNLDWGLKISGKRQFQTWLCTRHSSNSLYWMLTMSNAEMKMSIPEQKHKFNISISITITITIYLFLWQFPHSDDEVRRLPSCPSLSNWARRQTVVLSF